MHLYTQRVRGRSMQTMKYLRAALLLALAVPAASAQPGERGSDLRLLLKQASTAPNPPPPRQLSEQERAELRKQLSESSRRPAAKGS